MPGASDDLDYFNMEPLSVADHGSYVLEVLDHLEAFNPISVMPGWTL